MNAISLALGFIGLAASIYFYLRSKREKRPVFLTRTFPLVKNSVGAIPGLAISFNEKPIKSLSLTRLAFWNAGSETINWADIVRSDPLRVEVEGGDLVVGAKLSFVKRDSTDIALHIEGDRVLVLFEYLDRFDGAVLDIYHAKSAEISLVGTIKGSAPIRIANPAVALERRVNKIVDKLPSLPKFPFIRFPMIVIYSFMLVPLILPVIVLDLLWAFYARMPKEYSLES